MALSDEDLARIAFGAIDFSERWEGEPLMQRQMFIDIARALRAALAPPVTPEDTALSDEQYEQVIDALRDVMGDSGFTESDLDTFAANDLFHDIIGALRSALAPPVTPLAPGEETAIAGEKPSDSFVVANLASGRPGTMGLRIVRGMESGDHIRFLFLAAAGVAELEATCRRWQAAQGEG